MTTHPDANTLPPLLLPGEEPPPQDTPLPLKRALPRHVPILDADFDDLVPGYGEADSWYEP